MAKLRYVKTLEQVKRAREVNPEFLKSRARQIRVEYDTDPAIHRALVPKPLEPSEAPRVCVTFSDIAMELSPDHSLRIGAAIFGVMARHGDDEGIYLLTMPMTTEQSVVGGRETYGEPKKIAAIELEKQGERVSASVHRMGFTYLSASGRLGEALGPREFTQHGFCFKASPSCEPDRALDGEPLLVRLDWVVHNDAAWRLDDGALELGASPLDPVADVPVRRITRFEYEEGSTRSNGRVLRSVPEEWVLPILHQRYDDVSGDGIEV